MLQRITDVIADNLHKPLKLIYLKVSFTQQGITLQDEDIQAMMDLQKVYNKLKVIYAHKNIDMSEVIDQTKKHILQNLFTVYPPGLSRQFIDEYYILANKLFKRYHINIVDQRITEINKQLPDLAEIVVKYDYQFYGIEESTVRQPQSTNKDYSLVIVNDRIITNVQQNIEVYFPSKSMFILKGRKKYVSCMTSISDTLISGSEDTNIRMWNLNTQKCIRTLSGHTSTVLCIHTHLIKYNEYRIISSAGTELKIWNPLTGVCEHTFTGHIYFIKTFLRKDGTYRIVTGSKDSTVKIWNPVSKLLESSISHTQEITAMIVIPTKDGVRIISGSTDKSIKIWDTQNVIDIPNIGIVTCLTPFVYEGKSLFISGSRDTTLRVFDLQGKLVHKFIRHTDTPYKIIILPDNRIMSFSPREVIVWNMITGIYDHVIPFVGEIKDIGLLSNGHPVVVNNHGEINTLK